ncbi:30836_t:CDS:1, partial [Gigaspora margarita]
MKHNNPIFEKYNQVNVLTQESETSNIHQTFPTPRPINTPLSRAQPPSIA